MHISRKSVTCDCVFGGDLELTSTGTNLLGQQRQHTEEDHNAENTGKLIVLSAQVLQG